MKDIIMTKAESAIGKIFGRLRIIGFSQNRRNMRRLYICHCNCGNQIETEIYKVLRGKKKSCGYLYQEIKEFHGMSHTNTYRIYRDMIRRCHTSSTRMYRFYGERGIKVCEQWRNSFMAFLQDMGERPSKYHTLERLNNDGNYEPNNVLWESRTKQANNRRSNRYVAINHELLTVADAVRKYGKVSYSTFMARIDRYKWPIEKALTTPTRKKTTA